MINYEPQHLKIEGCPDHIAELGKIRQERTKYTLRIENATPRLHM